MHCIDWTRLTALREDIGEESFADVAMLFVAEINEHLTRLLDAPDSATAGDFHFLRGSAANMGFAALVDECNRAEEACKSHQRPDLVALDASFRRTIQDLGQTLPEVSRAA